MDSLLALSDSAPLALLLMAGAAALCFYLGRRAGRPSPHSMGSAEPERIRSAASLNDRWQVESHELVREFTARLDTKSALLEQLIRRAESQADRLERLAATVESRSPRPNEPNQAVAGS